MSRRIRPRTAKRAAARENLKIGGRAEARGRAVPPTLAGFQAAFRQRGFDGLAEALISRHNQRMQRIEKTATMMQMVCLPHLAGYPMFDLAVRRLGGTEMRMPGHQGGKAWIDHLAWGLDSIAGATRLLMCLQPVGAAVIARTQLERWSSNLEFNTGLTQNPGEESADWLNRLWSVLEGSHDEVRCIDVGQLFADLSELLHGRGPLMPLAWLDVAQVAEHPTSADMQAVESITDALVLSVSRIRDGLATAASNVRECDYAKTIFDVPLVGRAKSWLPEASPYLYPLLPFFFERPYVKGYLESIGGAYHGLLRRLESNKEPREPAELWPIFAFGERRFRASTYAQLAYAHERKQFAAEFRLKGIDYLVTEAVLAGEMAGVLGLWLRSDPNLSHAADAFIVCASALRSATWLWLEDDDRAMGCLRPMIEQLARVRAWRIKPSAAAKIEANVKSTPRDWLEAASWRRLNILARALGEFVHGSTKVNHTAALHALIAIHDTPDPELANHTGRTNTLQLLINFLQVECARWLERFDSDLSAAYWRVIRINETKADKATEAFLKSAWAKRGLPLR